MDMMQHEYEGNAFPSQHSNYYYLQDHHRTNPHPNATTHLANHPLGERPPPYTAIHDAMPYHANGTLRDDDAYGAAAAAAAEADCYPSQGEFESIVQNYLRNLSSKKRDKALVDRRRYSLIVRVLKDPRNTAISTAQFRFWVKKMFQLVPLRNGMDVVCHDSKPVAMREEIYSILVRAHKEANHGGRDKTSALVRRRYSWIPKELIARFVRHCPFCISRRNGSQSPTMGLVPRTPPDYALGQATPPINAHGGVPSFLPLRHEEMIEVNKSSNWQAPCCFEPPASSTPVPTNTAADVAVAAAVSMHPHDTSSPVGSLPANYGQRTDSGPVSSASTAEEGELSSSSSCAVAPPPPPTAPSDSLDPLYQMHSVQFVTDSSGGGHQHVDPPPYMCYEKGQVYHQGRTHPPPPPPRHPHQHHQQHHQHNHQQDDYYFPTAPYLACDRSQPRRTSAPYSTTSTTTTTTANNSTNHANSASAAAAAAAAAAFMFPPQLSSPSPSSSFSSSSSASVATSSVLSSPISPPPCSSPSNQLSFAPAYHYMQPPPTSQPNPIGLMGQPF